MKIGLILEGGGMRGLYTSAILDYFLDTGLRVDGIISVSAGALFGINYVSQDQYRALRYNLNYIQDKRYISLHSLIKTGNIINKDFAFGEVVYDLDPFDNETFKKSPTDFYVTVTNLKTGKPEYFKLHDGYKEIEVLRASSALPFVSKPVEFQDNLYLDGGVADSIPYKKAKDLGFDKLIVILTRPIQYRKTKPKNWVIDLFYGRHTEFANTLKNRYLTYNRTVEDLIDLEDQGKVHIIRPSEPIEVGRLESDPQKLVDTYMLGLKDIQAGYPDLIDYLKD